MDDNKLAGNADDALTQVFGAPVAAETSAAAQAATERAPSEPPPITAKSLDDLVSDDDYATIVDALGIAVGNARISHTAAELSRRNSLNPGQESDQEKNMANRVGKFEELLSRLQAFRKAE